MSILRKLIPHLPNTFGEPVYPVDEDRFELEGAVSIRTCHFLDVKGADGKVDSRKRYSRRSKTAEWFEIFTM